MENSTTIANRNNNPGNIKDTSTGQFKTYSTPQEGYAALLNDLQEKKSGNSKTGLKPDSTLADFSKAYAPASDKNNPAQYTVNLANHMGVRPDAKISELDTGKWAEAIANAEGYKNMPNSDTPSPDSPSTPQNFEDYLAQEKNKSPSGYSSDQHSPERIAQYKTEQQGYDQNSKDLNSTSNIVGDTIKGIGDNLSFGGASTFGNELGGGLARTYNQTKGLLGGQDNSEYIPKMSYGKTVAGLTGTVAGVLASAAPELKGILKGSQAPVLTQAIADYFPEVEKGQSLTEYLSNSKLTNGQTVDAFTRAMAKASEAEKVVLKQAIDKILPQAVKEAGGKVAFAELYPTIAKTLGIVKNLSGGLIKTASTLGGLGVAGYGATKLYDKITK